jgi:TonB-dependent receptor
MMFLVTTQSASMAAATPTAEAPSADGGSESQSAETVVVTGTRLQALKVKQDAPNVLDIRPVSEIQKLPDVTLGEALQRVPGVSLETDTGEGRFVNIRGMDADLNGTTFDGVRLTASNASTPQGGGRAVAFDAFPSGIMGGVEVIKSLTPDIDAEGLGGIVNILPRTLPDGTDLLGEASLGSGVETLRGSPVWDGDATAGYRFGPSGSMTAIISYEYHSDWRGIDDLENGGNYPNFPSHLDSDLELRWYKYHRTRQGLAGGFTWDVDARTTLFARAFDAGYIEYANKHRLEIDNLNIESDGSTPVLGPGNEYTIDDAAPLQKFTDSRESVSNRLAEFGGHTILGNDILGDFRASWTQGEDKVPWSYGFEFDDLNPVNLEYNDINSPNHPSFKTLDGTNLADPSIYTSGSLSNSASTNQDQEVASAVDLTIPLPIDGIDGDLKLGGSARTRIRRVIGYANNGVNVGSMADFAHSNDQIFYDGLYNIGPMADLPALAAIPEDPLVADPTTYEHDNENVYAGYVQYSSTIDKLSLQEGVRIEATDASYNANLVDSNGAVTPSTNKQDYTNIFPDVNAKYQLTDELLVRLALSTSLARPGFNQITAAKSYDYDNNIISEGNPALKATTASNVDLTAEYYLPGGGIASGGLFYKHFDNYVIPTITFVPAPSPKFTNPIVELDSFSNIGAATAKGLELNYVQQFTFLPGPLSGFGFDGNFTYNATSGDVRIGEKHALPQTSPRNYNAELFYEKGPISVRLAASYVSANLWQVGSSDAIDLYSQPRFRLDFGGSYAITENFEWYVDVKNITNTKLEFTQTASSAFPVQREFYDTDFFFGIRAHL